MKSVLVLLDRNIDFSSLLLHPWHYGALIHDLIEINNNKIQFQENKSK